MKILLSANGFNPYLGSENFVGWSAAKILARDHELWVITGDRNRADLDRAAKEGLIPHNIHITYAGHFKYADRVAQFHAAQKMRVRFQHWNDYRDYTRAILPVAQELHRTVKFDVVHHVTIATWRVASPLWKLGIPFVFGPIGGYEKFPARFLPMLSRPAAAFELLRMISNVGSRLMPSVRACIRNANHVFAANGETEQLVRAIRGRRNGCSLLMQTFYSPERMAAFTSAAQPRNLDGPLRFFAGGMLEGRKGVALAFQALAKAKTQGVRFRYWVGQRGPELEHLKQLAARLGLQEEVIFGFLPGDEYRKELGISHAYLLPSFRDGAPATLMDAMLAGCVPIVADCGGPAHIVTDECGYKIPVSDREKFVDALAEVIVKINQDRNILLQKGPAAARRIAETFTDENYKRTVNAVYQTVARAKIPNK